MTNIEKLFDELELGEVDEDMDAQTVNGWAMDTLGRIPEEGDSFEAEGLVLKVLKMDGRRIEDLHILDNRDLLEEDEEEE
jgi:CBS domain containing-hemolysin-like protein